MAKKRNATNRSNAKNPAPAANGSLPAGFRPLSPEQGVARDWDAKPMLVGTWGGVRTINVKRGRKMEEQRVATARDSADGVLYTVWESAMLTPLFNEANEGDEVAIVYLGLGKAKPGQNPPKLFECGIR